MKKSHVKIIAAAALACLCACTKKGIAVIDFRGKDRKEVEVWAVQNNVDPARIVYKYEVSEEAEPDHVLSQSVAKGYYLNEGMTLEILLAETAPVKEVVLEDFSGKPGSDALRWLASQGFDQIDILFEDDDSLPEGSFISMTPSPGTSLGIDQSVTVRISSRSEDMTVELPDFTGKTREEIEKWGNDNNLQILVYEKPSSTVEKGYFIRSSYPAGTVLKEKTIVFVYISAGKRSSPGPIPAITPSPMPTSSAIPVPSPIPVPAEPASKP